MATEYGWLIEKKDRDGRPMWAAFSDGGVDWKYDANEACRFSRREDAEQLAYGDEVEAVTEHAFDDGIKQEPCPHAEPFVYCQTCKVSPCPLNLSQSEKREF